MDRCVVVLLFVLACLGGPSSALDPAEADTLLAFLNRFPLLLDVNPMDQYDYDEVEDYDYGGSWTKPFREVCTGGDGWDIHGIGCLNGHVDALRFSDSFGRMSDLGPLDLSGLAWLSQLPNKESVVVLMEAVFSLPSLKRVAVRWPEMEDFPITAFETANLTHLELSLPSSTVLKPTMLSFRFLEDVLLNYGVPLTNFLPSASTLRNLILKGPIDSFIGLSGLHQLETLQFEAVSSLIPEFSEHIDIPQSLRSITAVGWAGTNISIGQASSGLETLSISYSSTLTTIEYLPPSLKSFSFQSTPNIVTWPDWSLGCELESFSMSSTAPAPIPPGLTHCTSLKSLSFTGLGEVALDGFMAVNMSSAPLESFIISASPSWPIDINLPDVQAFLCTLSTSLRVLGLANTNVVQLPACMGRFSMLEELNMHHISYPSSSYRLAGVSSSLRILRANIDALGILEDDNSGWTTLAAQCPNLVTLVIHPFSGTSSPFPDQALMNLSFLEDLNLYDLQTVGSMPNNFLDALPNLKTLELSYNQLNGTIPTSGWASLESFRVEYNAFSEWPDLVAPGAPRLRELKITSNPLQSIPGDASFLMMPRLREISASSLHSQQPIPAFWNNGNHKLARLDLYDANFQGLVPDMNSPYMRFLDASHNNLCGPLPEVTGRMGMETLDFASNKLTGTIPASWGTNLAVYDAFSLSGTYAGGEIPFPLLHPHGAPSLGFLYLDHAYFTGPAANMSSFVNLVQLALEGVNNTWDFCSQNPDLPDSLGSSGCSVTLHPSICECESAYASCFNVGSYCASQPPISEEPAFTGPFASPAAREQIFPPDHICITHPGSPSLPPPSSNPLPLPPGCPLPVPGPSFQCIDGIWQSTGSVTQPSLTIPGSSTPGTTTIIIIQGNLTVTDGGITFNGFESQVVVNGCIFLGDNQVTIELTKEEIEQLSKEGKAPKTLLTSLVENNCFGSSDLSMTIVSVHKGTGSKGCRKVKAKNTGSTKSSLNVIFEIDNSTCNMIIIIPSVIGGLLIITAALTVIGLYLRHKKFSVRLSK